MTEQVAADELEAFVQRIEAQAERIADEQAVLKEIYAELKGRGYCAKTVRKIVALRKKSRDQIAAEEAVFDLYRAALGV